MPSTTTRSKGRPRRRLVSWLKRNGTHVCALCGEPIDMTLEWPDPFSWSHDHVQAMARGGAEYDRRNVREAHLRCNQRRGDGRGHMPENATSRRW